MLILLFCLAVLTVAGTEPASAVPDPGKTVDVIVELKSQAALAPIRRLKSKDARQRKVVELLKTRAAADQRPVRDLLAKRRSAGKVGRVEALWISNSLAVSATPEVVDEISTRPEVASVTPDATIPAPVTPTATGAAAPEVNLSKIDAPALWDLGYRGRGVVVASLDTGVDATHPDLATRWRGGTNSWFDPSGEHPDTPTDVSGHGTWTMGVMVGGSAGGTSIGVAPEAEWISAKIFDDKGFATVSGIHRSFQWLLDLDGDPATADAPDVVNNSWALSNPGCNLEFQPDLQALTTAGILPVFAAGNYGPNTATSTSPANNPEALAVGATNNADSIDPISSRGPSACGEPSNTFPEIVAPGVDIKTTDIQSGYVSTTGTSLSAPHVAGVLALLLGAYPALTPAQQREILTNSAVDLGPAGPDDSYGYGRMDALAAYDYAQRTFGAPIPDTTPPKITADPAPPPEGASVDGPISVALHSDGGEQVHYTLDGSAPDSGSRVYDGTRIRLDRTTTIRASSDDAAGNHAEDSFTYTIRRPTVLTLDASASQVVYGRSVDLSGTLSSGGAPLSGQTVSIEQRPADHPKAPFAATANGKLTTGPDGGFSLPNLVPQRNTEYRAWFAGASELRKTASPTRQIGVKVGISIATSSHLLRSGRSLTISGSVRPAHAGRTEITIWRGGRVAAKKHVSLKNSRFRLQYGPPGTGGYSVSARYRSHADHHGNTSRRARFQVVE